MPIGFHPLELVIILAILLLVFGPKRLPEMGSAIGKSIKEFRKGISELSSPKDEHEEEAKLPVSAENEMGKLNTTTVETDVAVNATTVNKEVASSTTTANKEVASSEAKVD